MKYFALAALIPAYISSAASSPNRTNLQSPARPSCSSSSSIPVPSTKHVRKRSSSAVIEIPNEWHSPTSSYMETKFGQSKSSGDYTISEQPERHLAAKHRIHAQLTSKEALKAQTTIAKEEKWRKLRSAQFGPRHKRTNSLPSLRDTGKLYALMELSEQYGRMISKCDSSDKLQQEASSVQKEFKKEVSNIGHLVSMVETTDFEHYVKSLAAQQRALDERMKTITETIAQCEDIIEKVSALSKQIEAFAKQPEAHTQESSSSRSSSDKRRSKTASFLSFGNKLP